MSADDEAMPTWVKVVGAITLALLLLFAGLAFFGGGEHGPGRHTPSILVGVLAW